MLGDNATQHAAEGHAPLSTEQSPAANARAWPGVVLTDSDGSGYDAGRKSWWHPGNQDDRESNGLRFDLAASPSGEESSPNHEDSSVGDRGPLTTTQIAGANRLKAPCYDSNEADPSAAPLPNGNGNLRHSRDQNVANSASGATSRLSVTWACDDPPSPTSEPSQHAASARGVSASDGDTASRANSRRGSASLAPNLRRRSTSGGPTLSKIAGNWTKRWRIKAYDRAFVVEPNVALFPDPLGSFRNPDRDSGVSTSSDIPSITGVTEFGPPELIMFRDKPDMVELPHASHLAKKPKRQYGQPQCVIQVDAILGMLLIKAYRFLVLVVESDVVTSLPPDCSPLGVVSEEERNDIEVVLNRCKGAYPPLRQIHAIKRVLLLPFHVPSGIYLGVKLNIDRLMPTTKTKRREHPKPRVGSLTRSSSSKSSRTPSVTDRGRNHSDSEFKDQAGHRRNVSTGDARTPWATYSSLEDLLGEIAGHVSEIERTLSKKTFFFSYEIDLTHSLQKQYQIFRDTGRLALPQSVPLWNGMYGRRDAYKYPALVDFVEPTLTWNYNLCKPFWEFGIDGNWIVPCIQGAVSSSYLNFGNALLSMVLIGRRSRCRGGTRYFARGVDQRGHVANFCESEFLACLTTKEAQQQPNHFRATSLAGPNGGWFSFVQIRGSIPLYWEQAIYGINPVPRVTGTKGANQRAFAAHQKLLEAHYGKVHYLDLLSESKQGESKLSDTLLETLVRQKESQGVDLLKDSTICQATNFTYTHWDFHQYVQQSGFDAALHAFNAETDCAEALNEIGYFNSVGPRLQNGVFRTNCLDCLDRTNVMQWFLCQRQLVSWLKQLPEGERLSLANGVKYNQELYGWLIRQTDSAAAVRAFTKSSQPTKLEVPSKLVGRPIQWNPHDRLRPSPPFPEATAAIRLSFLSLPDATNEEYRSYFVGGWTDDALSITYYRPQALVMNASSSSQGREQEPANTKELVSTTEVQSQKADEPSVPMGVPVTAPVESPADSFFPTTLVLKDCFSSLWADLGDLISVAYTGTGSVLTPLMRSGKSTILTNLTHIKRTVGRLYKQNFEDRFRQEAIDLILGLHRWSAHYEEVVESSVRGRADSRQLSTSSAPVQAAGTTVTGIRTAGTIDSTIAAGVPDALSGSAVSGGSGTPPRPGQRTLTDCVPAQFDLVIWTGTWNVGGGGSLATDNFSDWLKPYPVRKANVYCVCLQEIVDLSRGFTLLSVDRNKEDAVIRAIRKVLGDDYDLVLTKTMVGLCLTVFMENSLKARVINGDSMDCKMGFIGGQLGNKGAVAVRFELLNRTWCFVGVHLAPDKGGDKSLERVQQIEKTLNMTFPQTDDRVLSHDYLFVTGDFNFPAMAQISEIERWLETRNFEEFFRRDQLTWLRQRYRAAWGRLTEAPVLFWPSYKYNKGTSQYDRTRPPSWCDRVLFGGLIHRHCADAFQLIKYERVRSFMTSDHKPVYLIVRITETSETLKAYQSAAKSAEPKEGETLLDL